MVSTSWRSRILKLGKPWKITLDQRVGVAGRSYDGAWVLVEGCLPRGQKIWVDPLVGAMWPPTWPTWARRAHVVVELDRNPTRKSIVVLKCEWGRGTGLGLSAWHCWVQCLGLKVRFVRSAAVGYEFVEAFGLTPGVCICLQPAKQFPLTRKRVQGRFPSNFGQLAWLAQKLPRMLHLGIGAIFHGRDMCLRCVCWYLINNFILSTFLVAFCVLGRIWTRTTEWRCCCMFGWVFGGEDVSDDFK
jgi:hypothetical protein